MERSRLSSKLQTSLCCRLQKLLRQRLISFLAMSENHVCSLFVLMRQRGILTPLGHAKPRFDPTEFCRLLTRRSLQELRQAEGRRRWRDAVIGKACWTPPIATQRAPQYNNALFPPLHGVPDLNQGSGCVH
jgi:hypothetical protein